MSAFDYDGNVERSLPKLREIDLDDVDTIKEIITNNEITLLENELALLDSQSLGMNIDELDERDLLFALNYLDNEITNSYTEKKTKNDILNSFIMTFENSYDISLSIWSAIDVNVGNEDNPIYVKEVKIKDIAMYSKWKLRATKHWSKNRIEDYVFNLKTVLEGKLDRAEVLKEAIYSDAISDDVSERVKLESRKMASNFLGINKETQSNSVNIFHTGGGKELIDGIDNFTRDDYSVIDAEIEVIDNE